MAELRSEEQSQSLEQSAESLLDAGLGQKTPLPREPASVQLLCVRCWTTFEGWVRSTCPRCGEPRPGAGWATMPFSFRDRYLFWQVLGRGGMGAVFLAADEHQIDEDKKAVAIKVVPQHSSPAARETLKRMFEREAAAAAMLAQSSSFVRVLGHDVSVEPAYLVMEYVDWPTLRGLLRRRADRIRPLSPVKVARIGTALLRGLSTMHFHRIVHRDLKPDNVFIRRAPQGDEYEVKILDLGVWTKEALAATPASLPGLTATEEQAPVGTFSYMSPEQLAMEPVSAASDLHTVGSLLWELVTGRVPYPMRSADGAPAVTERLERMKTRPQRPDEMPQGLYEILCKALSFEPSRRWESAEELRSALKIWVAEEILRSEAAVADAKRYLGELESRVAHLREGLKPQVDILEQIQALGDRLVVIEAQAEEASPRGLAQALIDAEQMFKNLSGELGRYLKTLERNLIETDLHAPTDDLDQSQPRTQALGRAGTLAPSRSLRRTRVTISALGLLIGLTGGGYLALRSELGAGVLGRAPVAAPEPARVAPLLAPSTAILDAAPAPPPAPRDLVTALLGDGHSAGYVGATFSPRGDLLASGSADGSVRLFRPDTGQAAGRLLGHEGVVFDAAFSPNGRLIATACEDGLVRLFEVTSQRLVATMRGHRDIVRSVAFSRDGEVLASAGDDADIRLWSVSTGRALRTLRLDERASGKRKRGRERGDPIRGLSFADGLLAAAHEDGTISVWDTGRGALRQRFSAHEGGAFAVAFERHGALLATAGFDQKVRLFDAGGRVVLELGGHQHQVRSVAISADGRLLASGGLDRLVRVFNVPDGKELHRFDAHGGGVYQLSFSPDGRLLASGGHDRQLRLWDLRAGREARTIAGRAGLVLAVAIDPRGERIASAGQDAEVRLLDAKSGLPIRNLQGAEAAVESVAFSPDGSWIAGGGHDRRLRIWKAASGEVVQALPAGQGRIRAVAFSPDARLVAAGGDDRFIGLWDPRSGREAGTLRVPPTGVRAIAFSPDGGILAAAGEDATVRLWSVSSGRVVRKLSGARSTVRALAFSPDGVSLAAAGDDRSIRLYDARTGELVRTHEGHQGGVRSLAFSPNGALIASASLDRTIKIWAVDGPRLITSLEGHELGVSSIAFASDGERIVSGGLDSTLRVWHWPTATWMTSAPTPDGWAVFDDRGRVDCRGKSCEHVPHSEGEPGSGESE